MSGSRFFGPVDNAPLVVFRIFFGFLLAVESFGAMATGWVRRNLIEPEFTFSYIGLEWLQPLPGNGMYGYFAAMGILGILVMLGYRYRLSMGLFALLWGGAYLMQKSSYNNHYYLLWLVSIMMCFLPAADDVSLDARRGRRFGTMPGWCSWMMIAQVAIVYFFAAVSKLYPGWMDGTFVRLALRRPAEQFGIGLFSEPGFALFIAWTGFFFDLLIVPLLLWKRTRTIALLASLAFHLFNAVFLQIGIFPFFALSFVVFFYPPQTIRKLFLRRVPPATPSPKSHRRTLWWFFVPYFVLQVALPVRHWFIEGDVLWTEEGHRLSWRMMLRQRTGDLRFRVVDPNGRTEAYPLYRRVTRKQLLFVQSRPDGIWQMAQRIREEYAQQGRNVKVYADCRVSINEGPFAPLIDPNVDLAAVEWEHFRHHEWVLPYRPQGR